MSHIVRQVLWCGDISHIPFRLAGRCNIQNINKIVRPLSTLKCIGSLSYENGEPVVICSDCVNRGITSPISYLVWNAITTDACYVLDYDVCILCNGVEAHMRTNMYYFVLHAQ